MADTPKKRGLNPEQWVAVRKRCESGESFTAVASSVGIQRQTISRRAKREGWNVRSESVERGRTGNAPPAASGGSNVVDAKDRFRGGKALEDVQNIPGFEGLEHDEQTRAITQAVKRTMAEAMQTFADDLKAGKIKPAEIPGARDRSQVMKDALGAWKLFQSMFREDEGLKSGQPTVPKDNDDGKPAIIELEIVDGPPQAEAS